MVDVEKNRQQIQQLHAFRKPSKANKHKYVNVSSLNAVTWVVLSAHTSLRAYPIAYSAVLPITGYPIPYSAVLPITGYPITRGADLTITHN